MSVSHLQRGNENMASVQDKVAALNIVGKFYSPLNPPLGNICFMVQGNVFLFEALKSTVKYFFVYLFRSQIDQQNSRCTNQQG